MLRFVSTAVSAGFSASRRSRPSRPRLTSCAFAGSPGGPYSVAPELPSSPCRAFSVALQPNPPSAGAGAGASTADAGVACGASGVSSGGPRTATSLEPLPLFCSGFVISGIPRAGRTYHSTPSASAHYGGYDAPERLPTRRMTPRLVQLNSLIKQAISDRRYDDALDVYEDMPNEGCTPARYTFKILLVAMRDCRRPHEILRLQRDMDRVGVLPDADTYRMMLEGLGRAGNPGPVFDIIQRIERSGTESSLELYSSMLYALCMVNRHDHAFGILEEYRSAGLPVKKLMTDMMACFTTNPEGGQVTHTELAMRRRTFVTFAKRLASSEIVASGEVNTLAHSALRLKEYAALLELCSGAEALRKASSLPLALMLESFTQARPLVQVLRLPVDAVENAAAAVLTELSTRTFDWRTETLAIAAAFFIKRGNVDHARLCFQIMETNNLKLSSYGLIGRYRTLLSRQSQEFSPMTSFPGLGEASSYDGNGADVEDASESITAQRGGVEMTVVRDEDSLEEEVSRWEESIVAPNAHGRRRKHTPQVADAAGASPSHE